MCPIHSYSAKKESNEYAPLSLTLMKRAKLRKASSSREPIPRSVNGKERTCTRGRFDQEREGGQPPQAKHSAPYAFAKPALAFTHAWLSENEGSLLLHFFFQRRFVYPDLEGVFNLRIFFMCVCMCMRSQIRNPFVIRCISSSYWSCS